MCIACATETFHEKYFRESQFVVICEILNSSKKYALYGILNDCCVRGAPHQLGICWYVLWYAVTYGTHAYAVIDLEKYQ